MTPGEVLPGCFQRNPVKIPISLASAGYFLVKDTTEKNGYRDKKIGSWTEGERLRSVALPAWDFDGTTTA
jgi:hypothetical protein